MSSPSSDDVRMFSESAADEPAWKLRATQAIVEGGVERLRNLVAAVRDPLGAAVLGSSSCGVWWSPGTATEAPTVVVERRIGRCYAAYLQCAGDATSLAALRALQLGGSDGIAPQAAIAADRLAAAGVEEPGWWSGDAGPRARRGARLTWDVGEHRFTSFLLETAHLGAVVTLGVAAQQDRSGVVGDVALFADLDRFRHALREAHEDAPNVELTSVAAACLQIRRAIERTDLLGTGDPPGCGHPERDYAAFRGLAQRWSAAA